MRVIKLAVSLLATQFRKMRAAVALEAAQRREILEAAQRMQKEETDAELVLHGWHLTYVSRGTSRKGIKPHGDLSVISAAGNKYRSIVQLKQCLAGEEQKRWLEGGQQVSSGQFAPESPDTFEGEGTLREGLNVLAYGRSPGGTWARFHAVVTGFTLSGQVIVRYTSTLDGNTQPLALPCPPTARVHRCDIVDEGPLDGARSDAELSAPGVACDSAGAFTSDQRVSVYWDRYRAWFDGGVARVRREQIAIVGTTFISVSSTTIAITLAIILRPHPPPSSQVRSRCAPFSCASQERTTEVCAWLLSVPKARLPTPTPTPYPDLDPGPDPLRGVHRIRRW